MNYTEIKKSSTHSIIKASKVVYTTQKDGINNNIKHGSGGNSYNNFLKRKKGIILTNCC